MSESTGHKNFFIWESPNYLKLTTFMIEICKKLRSPVLTAHPKVLAQLN